MVFGFITWCVDVLDLI
ncbi:BnaC03g33840D [Brassica napus]|uniref:BnaC03g33840D protein n=1 Tax=Brassica napus TaxID=3708 RepID=A0A078HV75_BRANA|nr:BnaC03g33840D [Brassica napus]